MRKYLVAFAIWALAVVEAAAAPARPYPPGFDAGAHGTKALDLTALERSLLFGNPAVHDALMNLPFTVGSLTNNGAGLGGDPENVRARRLQQALYTAWS